MKHSYLKSLSKLLILVMALLPLQSMAVSVDMAGSGTMPCSMMGNMSMEQDKMDMDKPCQMEMKYAQSCVNCDYSSVGVFLLTAQSTLFAPGSQPTSTLSIQFTTNTTPPPIRPPIKTSIS